MAQIVLWRSALCEFLKSLHAYFHSFIVEFQSPECRSAAVNREAPPRATGARRQITACLS